MGNDPGPRNRASSERLRRCIALSGVSLAAGPVSAVPWSSHLPLARSDCLHSRCGYLPSYYMERSAFLGIAFPPFRNVVSVGIPAIDMFLTRSGYKVCMIGFFSVCYSCYFDHPALVTCRSCVSRIPALRIRYGCSDLPVLLHSNNLLRSHTPHWRSHVHLPSGICKSLTGSPWGHLQLQSSSYPIGVVGGSKRRADLNCRIYSDTETRLADAVQALLFFLPLLPMWLHPVKKIDNSCPGCRVCRSSHHLLRYPDAMRSTFQA